MRDPLPLAPRVLAVLAAFIAAAAAADAPAIAELRSECFRRVHELAVAGPIEDVAWSDRMTLSVEDVDLAAGVVVARMGRSTMRLPIRTVDELQLARLMSAAAGPASHPDLDACVMAAALFRLEGDDAAAREALERAKLHASGVDERFAEWAGRLGLETAAQRADRRKADDAAAKAKDAAPETSAPPAAKTAGAPATKRHAIAKDHPRLFGPRARLQALAQERKDAFAALIAQAKRADLGDNPGIPTRALAYAVTGDPAFGRAAIEQCQPLIHGPIKSGHVPFGHDLAWCAIAYDLCWDQWTADERAACIAYIDQTIAANVGSETSVLHNGWWGYKNWGIGLACYATMYENPQAADTLKALSDDYAQRGAPALTLAGDGGGWAEGHYLSYWLHDWLVFTESARLCEGADYYALAPKFYANRALCSLFDVYPGTQPTELNRMIPLGDGGYGEYGGATENNLAARRILCGVFRADPIHQAIAAYNDRAGLNCIPDYAWWTFLFDDRSYPRGDCAKLDLSHYAAGEGDVFARSAWDGDATWMMFHCGDRFTAHQHLDVGHVMIFRKQPLLGDAGVYDSFGGDHDTNFYIRTIAHNSVLIYDPAEKWPAGIRAFAGSTGNDGGQQYPWLGTPLGQNGGAIDAAAWQANRAVDETGDMVAYADEHAYVYAAGDGTKAYWPEKCQTFTRQVVFLRPSTVVIFDRVRSKRADQRKYWIANLYDTPASTTQPLVSTHGDGRLFLQTVLPADAAIALRSGADFYAYFGQSHPPTRDASGPVPTCRVEVSARKPAESELFLHVLTATDAKVASVPTYAATVKGNDVAISVGPAAIVFSANAIGGSITIDGKKRSLAPNLKPNAP